MVAMGFVEFSVCRSTGSPCSMMLPAARNAQFGGSPTSPSAIVGHGNEYLGTTT